MTRAALVLSLAASVLVGGARGLGAQAPARAWEPAGFDFSPAGVWRAKARRVAGLRAAALARGDFGLLNRAIGAARRSPTLFAGSPALLSSAAAQAAVSGTLQIPTLLVRFKNSTPKFAAAEYDSVLFGSGASRYHGRPYSVRTFYEEISHGLMSVQGVVVGWITLDSAELYYAGGSKCNGLCGNSKMDSLIAQAVRHADSTVNFSVFDSQGSGQVDLLWLVKPTVGAECPSPDSNVVIWSHRYSYSNWTGSPLPTSDGVAINDYTIQSGVGGASACDTTQIMPVGTIAHETGHGLGLPDLYDPTLATAGIGHWGLMGSGNYARPLSPAHMEAWSLAQLGWVALAPVTAAGTYTLNPVETSDTVLIVRPDTTIANPHHEYFLLENRRGINADSALIALKGGQGGLLVWHIDSLKVAGCGMPNNCVNAGAPPHGVALMQADGLDQLDQPDSRTNRGDGGDPFPGASGNVAFGPGTNPGAVFNTGTVTSAGFAIDSIRSLAPDGAIAFFFSYQTLRTPVMGAPYADTIRVAGTGWSFALATGKLPTGLTLSSAGVVSGIPTRDSLYRSTVQATSGATTITIPVFMQVIAPTLAVDSVVKQLLLGGARLTGDQLRYLDLIGNNNNGLDLGDVIAWLDKTGVSAGSPALSRLLRRQY